MAALPHPFQRQATLVFAKQNQRRPTRGERAAVKEGHPSKVWARVDVVGSQDFRRPKFLRGGCLDGSAAAATATKERLTFERRQRRRGTSRSGAQQPQRRGPQGRAEARSRCRRPGRGAFQTRGLAAPGGGGRAERGPGRRPARHEHPQPRGAGGAERDQREPDFARRAMDSHRHTKRDRAEAGGVGCSAISMAGRGPTLTNNHNAKP